VSSNNTKIDNPKNVARLMLKTLWSTTWRIFGPVMVLFGIGLVIDLNMPTKPWGMALGAGLGIVIAVILVMRQLKTIKGASIINNRLVELNTEKIEAMRTGGNK